MLLSGKEIVQKACEGDYAVGAFNVVNMEAAQAIFYAAEETRSPFIMQVTQTTLDYTEPDELTALILAISKRVTVPFALHLDHGRSYDLCKRFMDLGFTSIMIDGSLDEKGKKPSTYEENVAVTRQVLKEAIRRGISVEAEIGRLGQIGVDFAADDPDQALTVPEEAVRFLEAVKVNGKGIDYLAVSIGTHHGLFKGTPVIRHDLIEKIREETGGMPLVMHGGTGVPDEDVQKAVIAGIRKINIDTEIRVSFQNAVQKVIHDIEEEQAQALFEGATAKYDIRRILKPAREAMKEAMARKMRLFGSAGKA